MKQDCRIEELNEYNPFSIDVNELCPNKIYDLSINGHDFHHTYTRQARNHRYWKVEALKVLMDDWLGYDRTDSKYVLARTQLLLMAMEQNIPRDQAGRCERSVCEMIVRRYETFHKKLNAGITYHVRVESERIEGRKCPDGIPPIDKIKEELHALQISILHIESNRISLESKDPKDYSAEYNAIRDKEVTALWEQSRTLEREYAHKLDSLRNILIEMGMKDIIIWPKPLTFDVDTNLEIEEDEQYIWVREGNKMTLSKRKKLPI